MKPSTDVPDAGSGLRVFINYRRDDTPGQAGRLYDDLTRRFGEDSVFMDVDKIDLGVDFKEAIEREVGHCDVLVALIGRRWLSAEDPMGRRRLENPEDYVRLEIEAALSRNVRVIPALLEGTVMPTSDELPDSLAGLARRNGLEIGDGARWRYDVGRLVTALERMEPSPLAQPAPGAEQAVRATTPAPVASGAPVTPGAPPPAAPPPAASAWRRRRWAIVAAVLVALGGIAAAAVLLGRGSGSAGAKPAGAAPSAHGGRGFPDAIEDELLLAHIPEGIRHGCRRASLAPDVLLRSVDCTGPNGIRVTYGRAHSGDALRRYFLQKVNAAEISFPSGRTCRGGAKAAVEWVREGLQTHVEGLSHDAEGRVLCFDDPSRAWVAWTDTPTKIFAIASSPVGDRRALYSWWRTAAGPEKELAMDAGVMAHGTTAAGEDRYPDAIEEELLLNHLPPAIARTCRRSAADAYDRQVFLRAVDCRQDGNAGPVRFAYAHSGTALKAYAVNRQTAVGLNYASGPTCADGPAAANPWVRMGLVGHVERSSGRLEGRVLCYEQGGRAWLEWLDAPTGIYASASRPVAKRAALYAWWRKRAGPGTLEQHMTGAAMDSGSDAMHP
jgi:TIR domain-containing protein